MQHIHTLIEDPMQLRKQILESALDSTEALKCTDSLKGLDNDMIIFRKQLKMMVKTLKMSIAKFQQSLPDLPPEFKEIKRPEQNQVAAQLPERTMITRPELFIPEREKFEQDLETIRDKIKALQMLLLSCML